MSRRRGRGGSPLPLLINRRRKTQTLSQTIADLRNFSQTSAFAPQNSYTYEGKSGTKRVQMGYNRGSEVMTMLRTVYVRYKNAFARTDAEDCAMYLSELLRVNAYRPNFRFYLIVAENRMFAVGNIDDEKSEQWRLMDFRYIRDEDFRPYFLFFAPFGLWAGEYSAILYGGIMGRVRRERPALPLHFYLLPVDLELTDGERKAGATKEAIWDIFDVRYSDGTATIRPLLSDAEPLSVEVYNISASQLSETLANYVAEVFRQ